MPLPNFTRDDVLGVAAGTVLLALFLIPPGYMLGWALDLLDFRAQSFSWRILLSLTLSVSIVPILIFLMWSYLTITAVWIFYIAAAAGMLCLSIVDRRPAGPPGWILWPVLGWAAIAILSGIDWQIGNRLYPSVMCYDFNLRAALVGGIARHGLPALNALFHPGHAVPLRYHYFWFLPCALIERWSGSQISARQTLIASDVWCGWALMATVAVYLRYFHPAGERGIERRTKWGIALLAVAGLDIIPNLFFDTFHALTGAGIVYASSEWWNTQVTGLPDAVLWVAHHVAAVPACFMGFLLLWRPPRLRNGVCAGLCFASAAGLSIYVAFTFSIFLVVYGAVQLWRKPWPEKLAWIVAGVCAVGCAAPYVIGLLTAGGPPGSFVLPP